METSDIEIVSAKGSGGEPTLIYKGRALYSRYDPVAAIKTMIGRIRPLEGTLYLLPSPALFYGVSALIDKIEKTLPPSAEPSYILAVELEGSLYDFSRRRCVHIIEDEKEGLKHIVPLSFEHIPPDDIKDIRGLPFKRIVCLRFSSGYSLHEREYDRIFARYQEQIDTYWRNRITIMSLGRLYSANIIKHLHYISHATLDIAPKVDSPILVCGAGESLIPTLEEIRGHDSPLYILAADAAGATIRAYGVHIDSLVSVEAQFAIRAAFFALKGSGIPIYIDMCSRPDIQDITGGDIGFFTSLYARSHYIEGLCREGLLPTPIPALGNVGSVALEIALRLRRSQDVPIYITGLDFSYTVGVTHARGTEAHIRQLLSTDRLHFVDAIDAAYSRGVTYATGVGGKVVYTSQILAGYARTFRTYFGKEPNIYDVRSQGLDLGLTHKDVLLGVTGVNASDTVPRIEVRNSPYKGAADEWLHARRSELEEIQRLIALGERSSDEDSRLLSLLETNDYLYLHFPDGYKYSLRRDFLARVAGTIDYYLKWM